MITFSLTATSPPPFSPHEWLENTESSQTQEWLQQQQSKFQAYITPKEALKNEIKESLKKFVISDSFTIPRRIGPHYYYTSRIEPEKQHKLYARTGLQDAPQLILDPKDLGSHFSIENFIVSPNGKLLACCLSENGSDRLTCRIKKLDSDTEILDSVERIKFSPVVWSADSRGFFYSRFDSEIIHSIHYHALGTSQEEDRLVFQDVNDGSVGYTPFISRDNRYLIIDAFHGSAGPNTISYLDLQTPDAKPVTIIPNDGGTYWFICSRGTKLYFLTNKDVNFKKVICVDIDDPEHIKKDFIPENKFTLEYVVPVGDYFCALNSENAVNHLALYDREGQFVKTISFPAEGKITLNRNNQNAYADTDELFFSFTNFSQPQTIFHYQIGSDVLTALRNSRLNFNSCLYETKQVFYTSKDGTQIPMFLLYKQGIDLDGSNQTLLTGYGAYGFVGYPQYNAAHLVWLERGGVLALANIRGGGEYGESWHQAGTRENKQNSFDDFIAAAEWLIENKYTKPARLATIGMSSGGLLVAASANQRPELFKAVVVEAGLLDLLKFHLFTVGRFWIQEHGNPDDPKDFAYLAKYSPCHNVKKAAQFPAVLVTASEHDDRVVPSHSYKYLAAVQEVYPQHNILLQLSRNVGHDASKSSDWVSERAEIFTFIYSELEKDTEPKKPKEKKDSGCPCHK
jgi:prolyl oligopeptidase